MSQCLRTPFDETAPKDCDQKTYDAVGKLFDFLEGLDLSVLEVQNVLAQANGSAIIRGMNGQLAHVPFKRKRPGRSAS